jgi:hemerythrin-like domain-containing protein
MTTVDKPADTRDMPMVHTVFRREFAALGVLVRGVPSEDTERAHTVAEHVDILLAMLEAHHRAEDVHLWPKLLDRGGVEVALVVELMEEQHESIERLTSQSLAALATWRTQPKSEQGEALADELDLLFGLLDEHMGLEEERILPAAEKYVTATEWHAMAGASGAAISAEKVPLVFGMTLYEADPEVMENTLSTLPPAMRKLLEEQGPRDFAAHSERVHGTSTPRRSTQPTPDRQ